MNQKIDTWQIMSDFLPEVEEIDFLDDILLLVNFRDFTGARHYALASRIENEFMIATSNKLFGVYFEDSQGIWCPTENPERGNYFWIRPDDSGFNVCIRKRLDEGYRTAAKVRYRD